MASPSLPWFPFFDLLREGFSALLYVGLLRKALHWYVKEAGQQVRGQSSEIWVRWRSVTSGTKCRPPTAELWRGKSIKARQRLITVNTCEYPANPAKIPRRTHGSKKATEKQLMESERSAS